MSLNVYKESPSVVDSQMLESQNDAGQQARPCFPRIPHEILLMIFRKSLPPPWLLHGWTRNILTPRSMYSTDLTAKLSILAVCKDWHQVATEILYEIVHLRRIGQLAAFVRALEEHAGLGDLVKRLDLSCMVPRGYSTLFQNETQILFRLCPRLSHLSFVPVYLMPGVAHSLSCPTALSITTLELSGVVEHSVAVPLLLELCSSLRSLSIVQPTNQDGYPALTFPVLEDLRLTINAGAVAVLSWQAPSLRALWLTLSSIPILWEARVLPHLRTFGRTITFLSLYLKPLERLEDVIPECPSLEHLVIGPHIRAVPPCEHRNIKYVDSWEAWKARPRPSATAAFALLKPGFPALRRCRYFDRTYSDLWDLPVRFPPAEEDAGAVNAQSWLAVVLEWTEPEDETGDDDNAAQPSTAQPSVGESESDSEDCSEVCSDSRSAITVSEEGTDEEEIWEIDRTEALEIFSRTLIF
ncbi:hypothetical protein C8R46DRAFT_160 [Mycena filopes]|nr:hypothetical protein C8R46DRAFT_160 [Mycena filopes]